MSLFSTRCSNPDCNATVDRFARFCPKCGTPSPRGWTRCPKCRTRVAVDARFCSSCREPLPSAQRGDIERGRWTRPAGAVAERFNVEDIRQVLRRGVIVEAGTIAILLESGAIKDVLGPGQHSLDSLRDRIRHWGEPAPRTVILVESGEIVLPLKALGLRCAGEVPIEFHGEAAIRIGEERSQIANFVANLFKNATTLTCEAISSRLEGAIRSVVSDECLRSTPEELIKDPQRRIRIEDALQRALHDTLAAYGLVLVRVPVVEFGGEAYEKLRKQAGDIELRRLEYEYNHRLREVLILDRTREVQDEMTRRKLEADRDEYVAQLALEKGISEAKRDQDLRLLKQVQAQEIERREALYRREQEMADLAHRLGLEAQAAAHRRQQQKLETASKTEVERMLHEAEIETRRRNHALALQFRQAEHAQELRETEDWLRVKAEKRKADREDLAETLKIKREDAAQWAQVLQGRSLQELIVLVPDAATREHLLQLHEQTQRAGLSAEQLLALAAASSPEAAAALKELLGRRREDMEREFREKKEMMDEFAARFERMFSAALEMAKEAAKRPESSIILPSGALYTPGRPA